MVLMKVSDQIRQIIRESGMTQTEINALIELDPATMSRFMHGKGGLSVEVLDRLGDLFKLKVQSRRSELKMKKVN